MRRPLMPHDLDRQRGDRAGAGLADRWPGGPIKEQLGHMEQQIDHALPARRARDQLRHRRTYAAQRCRGAKSGLRGFESTG